MSGSYPNPTIAKVTAASGDFNHNNHDGYNFKTICYDQELATTASSSTCSIAWQSAARQVLTVNANTTLSFSNNPIGPTMLTLRIVNGSGGPFALAMPSGIKYQGGTAYTITATANAQDICSLYWNGSTYYCTFGNGFA